LSYDIIWEFRVPPDRRRDFEEAYGANGVWAELFGRSNGFIEVRLFASPDEPGRYLTMDRWATREAFDAFHQEFGTEYDFLDKLHEGIAVTESRVGAFVETE
jgi:heme-degrading monooxygenase HmoA